jgi:hypothetical protein
MRERTTEAKAKADSLKGMTDREARAKAEAGTSTAFGPENGPNSAQDDNFCGG